MDRNMRIARELVRIARDLVEDEGVVVDVNRIVVSCDNVRTAADKRMTVRDNVTQKLYDEEERYDRNLRYHDVSVETLFKSAVKMIKNEINGMQSHDGKIIVGGTGTAVGYIRSHERYGKVSLLIDYTAGRHGSDIGIFFTTMVKSSAKNKIETIEKRFVPVDFVSSDNSVVDVKDGYFVSDNAEMLDKLPKMVMQYLDDNTERLSDELDERLYRMNTVWWKRFLNEDRY